jgi:hypothetical protein
MDFWPFAHDQHESEEFLPRVRAAEQRELHVQALAVAGFGALQDIVFAVAVTYFPLQNSDSLGGDKAGVVREVLFHLLTLLRLSL